MAEPLNSVSTFTLAKPLTPLAAVDPADFWEDGVRLSSYALKVASEIPEEAKAQFRLLKLNILSAVHVKGVFLTDIGNSTPDAQTDSSCDPCWWQAANVVSGLCRSLGINLCSYCCENDGKLFVHLVPTQGESESALKSRGAMRGHTDAMALPFPGELSDFIDVAHSPDLVILVGLRNPNSVSTNIAPLSSIMRKLTNSTIASLQENWYDFKPQSSFEMSSEYVHRQKPVLCRDQNDGYMIRFSHSRVVSEANDVASHALTNLKDAVEKSFVGIEVQAGDVLFVNNRTALHGRSEVGPFSNGPRRWLLRSYGMYEDYPGLTVSGKRGFVLQPSKGGPTQRRSIANPS
jgi:hypothetical protein